MKAGLRFFTVMKEKTPAHVLPVIVFSQFAGTSLWFAGNAVVNDLAAELDLLEMFVGFITMAVQGGFIIGTLVFAFLNIADRFSPVKVFLFCAIAGALANAMIMWSTNVSEVLTARFMTGFFLAGIYPVGMKIAADWHRDGLGKALGFLVGALVLGTAFPHLLRSAGGEMPWRYVMAGTSLIAAIGGFILFLTVKDGPYKKSSAGFRFDAGAMIRLFSNKDFRSAAFGYFGHMWELYTFWAFVPVILFWYVTVNPGTSLDISLWAFVIIGIGSVSCTAGGYLSLKKGSKWVSVVALTGSGLCTLLVPYSFNLPVALFLGLLILWGILVIPDSPQFSTMVARSADPSYVATGLTIVNSLGFAITIASIQLVNVLWVMTSNVQILWVILIGPVFGLWAIRSYQQAKH